MGRTSAKPDSRHRSGGAAHRTRSVSLQPSATLPAASDATAAGQPERSCLGPHRDAVCVAKSDGGRGGLRFALRNLSWPGRPAKARTPCAPCCWYKLIRTPSRRPEKEPRAARGLYSPARRAALIHHAAPLWRKEPRGCKLGHADARASLLPHNPREAQGGMDTALGGALRTSKIRIKLGGGGTSTP